MTDLRCFNSEFRHKMVRMVLAANCCSVKQEEIKFNDKIDLFLTAPEDLPKILLEIWEYAGLNADLLDPKKFVFVKDIDQILKKELRKDLKKTIRQIVAKKLNLEDWQLSNYIFDKTDDSQDTICTIMCKFDIYEYPPFTKSIKDLFTLLLIHLENNACDKNELGAKINDDHTKTSLICLEIISIISNISGIPLKKIRDEDNLISNLGIEAADLASIIEEINYTFKITLPEIQDEELTVKGLINEILNHCPDKQ